MKIYYTNPFIRRYKKLPLKIQLQAETRIALFKDNPYHPLLENHPLKGKWKDCRSINITGDWRAIFCEIEKDVASFRAIDTHGNLYGR